MPTQVVKVKTSDENPEPVELIAQSIIQVSEAISKINSGSLRRRAIVLLIHDMIPTKYGVGVKQIEAILDYVPKLKDTYVKNLPIPSKK